MTGNDTLEGGAGNDELFGGDGSNVLLGGTGNDGLYGGTGIDTLIGGTGNDKLAGDLGNDIYVTGRGDGKDTITEYDATTGNVDTLAFGPGISTEQLWMTRSGNDLVVSIIGTPDKTAVSNWYGGSAYQVEQFKTSDGKTLLNSRVDALVSAMAAFSPPAAGQTALPVDYYQALHGAIAANWR